MNGIARTKAGHMRDASLAVSRFRIIFDESSSAGAGLRSAPGWYPAPTAIRNAICGVFAAQKITAASPNEPYTRDLGRAR